VIFPGKVPFLQTYRVDALSCAADAAVMSGRKLRFRA
jgi:hypothetical protein